MTIKQAVQDKSPPQKCLTKSKAMIVANRRQKVREIVMAIGISRKRVENILQEYLELTNLLPDEFELFL